MSVCNGDAACEELEDRLNAAVDSSELNTVWNQIRSENDFANISNALKTALGRLYEDRKQALGGTGSTGGNGGSHPQEAAILSAFNRFGDYNSLEFNNPDEPSNRPASITENYGAWLDPTMDGETIHVFYEAPDGSNLFPVGSFEGLNDTYNYSGKANGYFRNVKDNNNAGEFTATVRLEYDTGNTELSGNVSNINSDQFTDSEMWVATLESIDVLANNGYQNEGTISPNQDLTEATGIAGGKWNAEAYRDGITDFPSGGNIDVPDGITGWLKFVDSEEQKIAVGAYGTTKQ